MACREYSGLPFRHSAMTRLFFFIAAISWLSVSSSWAQAPVIRQAGTYVLLLDSAGKPVAGSYWLSPELKIAVTATTHGGYPSEPIYLDREFMPQRRGVMLSFINRKISYSPDPLAVAIGDEVRIVRRDALLGPFAGAAVKETPIKFTATGTVATTISGVRLINRLYRIEPYDLSDKNASWGDRVYVETLDMDLSKTDFDLVTAIETGTALSSGDFYIKYMLKADVLPDQTKCLREKQALETYETMALNQRDGSDKTMAAGFIRDGKAFWETSDDFPADERAMNIYELCPNN
ncbi:hypothetical protein [Pararhizobium sp.]|uniref:hypothetical protein n=1 Tax=Pararhizobium sp. TaxID=1977563 RepID=UPI002718D034|nr:hypothetical protein [Pararhizobium sp.]MDO9418621.1 hypothetical protein [Pararhizobium sp.]